MSEQPKILTTWKEIAQHLEKGVRTVQRWEQELGLPIHRPEHHPKGVVFASTDELNQWRAMAWGQSQRHVITDETMLTSIEEHRRLRRENRQLSRALRR